MPNIDDILRAHGIGSATQLGGQPATNYLRTDSGAPNPQTVANQVRFMTTIEVPGNAFYWFNQATTMPTSVGMGYVVIPGGFNGMAINGATLATTGNLYAGLPTSGVGAPVISIGDSSGSSAYIDNLGNQKIAGTVQGVGGQSTAGSLGVAAVVAQALGVHVYTNSQQTILSFTPFATGLYEVKGYFWLNNSTSGNSVTFGAGYKDANSGVGVPIYFTVESSSTTSSSMYLDGSISVSNGYYSISSALIYALADTPINVFFTDPTNTPNDYISAVITRLA